MALILGTGAIVVVYLLLNLAYLYLVPLPEMAGAELIAATVAERIPLFAGAGGSVVAGVVMLSSFGTLNGSMMTGPGSSSRWPTGVSSSRRSRGCRRGSRARRSRSGSPPRSA